LSEQAIPSHFFHVNEFPLKTTGKVDVEKLIDEKVMHFEKNENTIIENDPIGKIWQQILKIESIDDNTHFFESGGNSLDSVVLLFEVEKTIGVKLTENYLFNYPILKEFKKNIDSKFQESFLVELKQGKQECPIYFIPWYNGSYTPYLSLIKTIKTDKAIYSFNKADYPKFKKDKNDIKEIALIYVNEIIQSCKARVLILMGSSFGGNIACEISILLAKKGVSTKQVHLLDSVEPYFYRLKNQLLWLNNSKYRLLFFFSYTLKLKLIKIKLLKFLENTKSLLEMKLNSNSSTLKFLSSLLKYGNNGNVNFLDVNYVKKRLNDNLFACSLLYKIGDTKQQMPEKTMLILYKADESILYQAEVCMGWKDIVPNLNSFIVKGNHNSILEKPYVYDLAEKMSSCL
jgi:thioesterase domain-containing protein/acyl carrier protein